jgi:hypothetical protein
MGLSDQAQTYEREPEQRLQHASEFGDLATPDTILAVTATAYQVKPTTGKLKDWFTQILYLRDDEKNAATEGGVQNAPTASNDRADYDHVGVLSDPETVAIIVNPERWTAEDMADHVRDDVDGDVELTWTECDL